jgi:hypothetical protein
MRRGVPSAFTSGATYAPTGELVAAAVNVREIPEDEAGWRREIETQTGIAVPESREVILTGVRLWNIGPTQNRHLTFRITDRSTGSGTVNIAELVKVARGNAARKPAKRTDVVRTRTRIVGLSDEQLGKVDRNGGTEAFFERIGSLFGDLEAEMKARPCEDAVILLGGDLIEGFENTPQQAHTNDLSHPEMLRVARAYLTDAVTRIASRHERVRVLAVPSNHGAWRRGKDNLGKPADDYGLDCVRAVAEALAMSERWAHVEFIFPQSWEVSVAVKVRDDVLALTHGHVGTSGPASFERWFLNQLRGDSPIGAATLIISGHYHHYRQQPLGNLGDRTRVHIQLPALDGGSSWFTNATGEWSHPGIWTAVICDGYGLDHERVLRPVR